MPWPRTGLALLLLAAATTVALAFARPHAPPAEVGARATVPAPTGAAPAPAVAAPAAAAKAAAGAPDTRPPLVYYPDGSTQPLLNGVRDAVTIAWPQDRPFAPVVEKVLDQGQEWYRHDDGSWTTSIVDQHDPARSIGLVYTPAPVKTALVRGR